MNWKQPLLLRPRQRPLLQPDVAVDGGFAAGAAAIEVNPIVAAAAEDFDGAYEPGRDWWPEPVRSTPNCWAATVGAVRRSLEQAVDGQFVAAVDEEEVKQRRKQNFHRLLQLHHHHHCWLRQNSFDESSGDF